jgi:hypothetical protein
MAPARPPHLLLGDVHIPLEPTGETDDALGAALGLAPGALRPGWRFRIEAGRPPVAARLRMVGADGAPWEPFDGHALPEASPEIGLPLALDRLAAINALRAATGLSMAALAPRVDLPADALAVLDAAPEGGARLVVALAGLDVPDRQGEAALVGALARAVAPGGVVLAALPGGLVLLGGAGGTACLLHWLRHGLVVVPQAAVGHRAVRTPAHLHAAWGGAFDVLCIAEGALSGLRDLVVLRRR